MPGDETMSEQTKKTIGEWANKGDAVERSTDVNVGSKVVRAVRTVKRNATDNQALVCEFTFDFSKLSGSELLEMAARQAVIDVQAMIRADKGSITSWARRSFVYPLERERTSKTAFEKVSAAVAGGKLSDAEREALLAMLRGDASDTAEEV
jgi:hypothetical protein